MPSSSLSCHVHARCMFFTLVYHTTLSYLRASQKTIRRLMQAKKDIHSPFRARGASNACPCLLDERPRKGFEHSGTSMPMPIDSKS
jgi:hypothetical protein